MSELYDRLKADLVTARVNREKTKLTILSVVIGELSTVEKNGLLIDDAMIIARLKKLTSSNEQVIKLLPLDDKRLPGLTEENEIIAAYFPRMLTEQQIDSIMNEYKFQSVKEAMAFFKANHAGRYDARYISGTFKK